MRLPPRPPATPWVLHLAFTVAIAVALSCAWSAAMAMPWQAELDADPTVPSLESFLGRPFADRHCNVDEIQAYSRLLARSSDRVEFEEFGTSVQGEPLFLLSIVDPAQRGRLAGRQDDFMIVRDPWGHSESERREAISRRLPAVWVACSIHGDEASGADAGLALAYRLAADQSPAVQELLSKTVVLIDPLQNPDGRRRFLQHVRSFGHTLRPDPSPWAAEHHQLWPGGRANHFLFDLNRDWAFQTQPETRARCRAFLRWRPQVFIDLHEMGRRSSYFFPPPAEPINPHVPESMLEWFDAFGRANARAFEERGYDYFVRETFDLFYPGYGDSWSTLQGAVGMTYEQASTRGRALRQRGGRIVGYREAVAHHFVAAWTTIETAARNDRELMASVLDFYDRARKLSERDERAEVVLSTKRRRGEARRLAELLSRQGIVVWKTTEPARVRLLAYESGEVEEIELPAGSFRIPMRQPDYGLVRSLLDPHTPLAERFLVQEQERRRRGLRSRFYDVTAWSLVYSYAVDARFATRALDIASVRLAAEAESDAAVSSMTATNRAYAWVLPYEDNSVLACLPELWREGIQVSCALARMQLDGKEFPRGSLVVARHSNAGFDDLGDRIAGIAARHGARVEATATGWSEKGPSLGSSRIVVLEPPRVGLLTGPGLSSLSAGAQSWLLEERFGLDFTSILLDTLDGVDLRDFDVLLLPEIQASTSISVERLRSWVRDGGVLVAVGRSVVPLLEAEEPFGSAELVGDLGELTDDEGKLGEFEIGRPPPESQDEPKVLPDDRRPLRTPGAILRVDFDPTHPLTLGPEGPLWVPYLSERLLRPSVGGKNVVTIDTKSPRAAGFMWPVMEEAVRGKAFLIEETLDRGRVVLFAEDPAFRGVWEGAHRLLLNAVLILPSLLR